MSDIGQAIYVHAETLFPLCRSITGAGLRQTLRYIGDQIQLDIKEVPTGTHVLDWEIPREWTVRGASIRTLAGEPVLDFRNHNLHLLQYSIPIDRIVPLEELQQHLFSLPDQPNLIPYRTAYYTDAWGFCLPHRLREQLKDPEYRVVIDTDIQPGSLTYGEYVLPGDEEGEFLFSIHDCHPSLANDNLSGIAVAIELARTLARWPRRRWTYRFLFTPGTIGSIAWLHYNQNAPKRVRHGLVLTCLGDPAKPTYKQSRRGNADIDRYAAHVLRYEGAGERILPFIPYGYDERQYCSPGFNLPVGCLMRSQNGTFPEYHTSADNLSFITRDALADSLRVLLRIVEIAETDRIWCNTNPRGEPQLGRRGLYAQIGARTSLGSVSAEYDQLTLLWVLNLADGKHTLLDIAERAGKPFESVAAAADALRACGLLVPGDPVSRDTQ